MKTDTAKFPPVQGTTEINRCQGTTTSERVEDQYFVFFKLLGQDIQDRMRVSIPWANHQQQDYDEPDVAEAPLTALHFQPFPC